MYNSPPPPFAPIVPSAPEKPKRGAFLTGVLVLRFIRDALVIFMVLAAMQAYSSASSVGATPAGSGRAMSNVLGILLIVACVDLAALPACSRGKNGV